MKKIMIFILLLTTNLVLAKTPYNTKYTRETIKVNRIEILTNKNVFIPFAPQLKTMRNTLNSSEWELFMNHTLHINMSNKNIFYIPIYKKYTHGKHMCGDMRNWHVATLKGWKYSVNPAFLVAIRSQENPNNDSYAYGVKYLKGTDLWKQGDAGAKCVKHWANYLHFNPMNPTKKDMYELAKIYVGTGDNDAKHWSNNVWCLYLRLQGEIN